MSSIPNVPEQTLEQTQEAILDALEIEVETEARASRMKIHYVLKSREWGVDYARIAARLGVTPAAVGNILKRNSESAA